MKTDPCNVCGATELNLVDGYYYCVECGTQDANVRETIVEQTLLADGSVAQATVKKFNKIVQDGVQMSGEWYKWHAFNFILASLTEELISLGAAQTVREKVLWIWIRYIKKYQIKDETSKTNNLEDDTINNNEKSNLDIENSSIGKFYDIVHITKTRLLTILYIALNLDQSDIQLSHLFKFAKEGRLSINSCQKFVPAGIDVKSISKWHSFTCSQIINSKRLILKVAMSFFKRLDLGVPLAPNLTKMIDNYLLELCLPLDFRDFVFALIHLMPCDFLQIDERAKRSLVRLPNYEVVCMSYILLGLKICFGLDDDYEKRLSDAVDTINNNENRVKSYKLGFQSETSDRLFSFRDWYNYLHLRKTMLSKYNIHLAYTYDFPVDDHVQLEQLPKKVLTYLKSATHTFTDDVAMDILNKVHIDNIPQVISKDTFPKSLTPLNSYLEVIEQFIQDPDLKLMLCEDYTQYSLKYALRDLKLPGFQLKGVSKKYKTINENVVGSMQSKISDKSMVYVRNCENPNWFKTNRPTIEHITKNTEQNSTSGMENGHDNENNSTDVLHVSVEETVDKIHTKLTDEIEEETIGVNIFDDEFILEEMEENKDDKDTPIRETHESECNFNETDDDDNINQNSYFSDANNDLAHINPDEIDRNNIIHELIEIACKKYKIPLPKVSTEDKPKKRKICIPSENTGETLVKKRKHEATEKRCEVKSFVNDLVSAYYKTLDEDVLHRLSEHVRNVVQAIVNETEANSNISQNLLDQSIDEHNISNGIYVPNETKTENEIDSNINLDDISHENSVVEVAILSDNETNESVMPKINPDYDANTHDTKQLYIKLEEELENEDIFDVRDTKLEKIIDEKLDGLTCEDVLKPNDNLKDVTNIMDSDEDLPLSIYREDKLHEVYKKKLKNLKLDPLMTEPNVKKFNCWFRHYKGTMFKKSDGMTHRFNVEIENTSPKSFIFVMKECSSIIECSMFSLYKSLQNLEQRFMCFNN